MKSHEIIAFMLSTMTLVVFNLCILGVSYQFGNKKTRSFIKRSRIFILAISLPIMASIVVWFLLPEMKILSKGYYLLYFVLAILSFRIGIQKNLRMVLIHTILKFFIMPIVLFGLFWFFGENDTALLGIIIWYLFLIFGMILRKVFYGFCEFVELFVNNKLLKK